MTAAVVRRWLENPMRSLWRDNLDEIQALHRRAFLPKPAVDIWYSDYCIEDGDVLGQWADDGGAMP